MDYSEVGLMYGLYIRSLKNPSALRAYIEPIVREIQKVAGSDADVQVSIEPECKDKSLYLVSIQVLGVQSPIIVKRSGKKPLAVLRRARKAVLRKLHRRHQRRLALERRRAGAVPLDRFTA